MTTPRRAPLAALFPPLARPDPAALRAEAARHEVAAAQAAAAPPLDLEQRLEPLGLWQGAQAALFSHVPYFVLIELLHLRVEFLAMPFILFVTHRYAAADRTEFTRRALLAGVASAVFCVALQWALGPRGR